MQLLALLRLATLQEVLTEATVPSPERKPGLAPPVLALAPRSRHLPLVAYHSSERARRLLPLQWEGRALLWTSSTSQPSSALRRK
jgi:hypothetical protein